MHLQASQKRRFENPSLSPDEQALLRCEVAKKCEESGNYEGAREALSSIWRRVGDRPQIKGLGPQTTAEVLLRVGTLSGWIASTAQIEDGQDPAKDLLSEGMRAFLTLGLNEKVAESQIELAYCYWREGNYDEALVWLNEADGGLSETSTDLRALASLRRSIIIYSKGNFHESVKLLEENAALFTVSRSHALKGKFHVNLATFLKKIGELENNEDVSDRALVEYAAASFHFDLARHNAYRAGIENQLGFLFSQKNRFADAHLHLDRARRLFVQLRDKVHTAQVDETIARTYLAQGNYPKAEKAAHSAVSSLHKGGQQCLLAEALATLGTAQARLGKMQDAKITLRRAADTSEHSGDLEGAARAGIIILEELDSILTTEEKKSIYGLADQHLSRSVNTDALLRLRACARNIIILERVNNAVSKTADSDKKKVNPQDILNNPEILKSDPSITIDWKGFSLGETVNELKSTLIDLALFDAGGSVTRAAVLLGLPNHGSLISMMQSKGIKTRTPRKPTRPRHKSLMKKSVVRE